MQEECLWEQGRCKGRKNGERGKYGQDVLKQKIKWKNIKTKFIRELTM